ncbi:MAG: hypothetical protein GY780_02505 [bacterium]|nr:hypothetical protein [bacterium]
MGTKKPPWSGQVVCFLQDVLQSGKISSGQISLPDERTAPGHGIAMTMVISICIRMIPMCALLEFDRLWYISSCYLLVAVLF